jgi:rhamnosyltransferase
LKDVYAVVILYNPNVDFLISNLPSMLSQVNKVILVDNSTESLQLPPEFNACVYIPNHENLGIAKAQNIGIKYAIDEGAEYVILFDQDSEVESSLISNLHHCFVESKETYKLACVGPRVMDVFSNKKVSPLVQKEIFSVSGLTICSQIIASGKMISKEAIFAVGYMEEELFIDGVDHEWCWRAVCNGFNVAIDENSIMTHQLGEGRKNFCGIKYKISAPIRLYYQFRNILNLSRRGYVPAYWKLRNLLGIPVRFFLMSLQPNRKEYIRYMLKGLFHGVKGQYGPINKQ